MLLTQPIQKIGLILLTFSELTHKLFGLEDIARVHAD
jgi:hypothetical protein